MRAEEEGQDWLVIALKFCEGIKVWGSCRKEGIYTSKCQVFLESHGILTSYQSPYILHFSWQDIGTNVPPCFLCEPPQSRMVGHFSSTSDNATTSLMLLRCWHSVRNHTETALSVLWNVGTVMVWLYRLTDTVSYENMNAHIAVRKN